MVGIDIQSLFADIIQSPGQRRQSLTAQGERDAVTATRGLTGRSQIFAPLVGALASSQGMRDEMLQRSVGGLFGLDTRNESEKLQQVLTTSDTSTAAGLEKMADEVAKLGHGPQAAIIRQQVQERRIADEEVAQRRESLIAITDNADLEPRQRAQVLRAIGTGAFAKADDLLNYIDKVTEDKSLARQVRQVLLPNGSITSIETDQRGNFFNMQGEEYTVPEGAIVVAGSQITGTAEELNLPARELTELRGKEVATATVIATVTEMLQMLEETPDINTIVGASAAFANNVRAEARAIANSLGQREEAERLMRPELYTSEFEELGIRNREMQSLIVGLAYAQARTNEEGGGRISDPDFKNAVKMIGGDSKDPVAFSRVLRRLAQTAERNFRIDYRTRTGQNFAGDLGLGNLPGTGVTAPVPTDPRVEARRLLEGLNL